MADEQTPATTSGSVTKREEEVKEAMAWLEIQKQFPETEFSISRGEGNNKVSLKFGLVPFKRGVFKEKGCKYIGVVEEITPENANKFIDFLTWERVKSGIENQLAVTAQAATDFAIDEQGRYNNDSYIKSVEEGSFRGETKDELLERQSAAAKASDEFLARCKQDPGYIMTEEGKQRMFHIFNETSYCQKALDSRKRGPKNQNA